MINQSKQYCKSGIHQFSCIAIVVFFLLSSFSGRTQTASYSQWCNEIQFARVINDKWAGEVFLGGTFSNTPNEPKVLSTNIQRYFSIWAHYYYSPRWKLTSSIAYYYNKDVPDIGQYFSPEYRLSLQGLYYFHKTGYTLSTRMRGEFRYIMSADGNFEDKYRYRQMVKFVKPLNSQILRQGVFYFMIAEELLFKPNAKEKGLNFFDRNRFQIGGGYLVTDDLQLEIDYLNEFMPRDKVNEVYNALELTITINNPWSNLKKHVSNLSGAKKQED